MKTRDLLGTENSLLGFGCMRFPTLENGKIDREQAFAMLDEAYAHGVTYYDTAFPYHSQESETVLGIWQKTKPRASLRIATKLPVWLMHSADEARTTLETQLQRLQTDHVDYYLLHALSAGRWKKVKELGLLELLDEWKAQGKTGKAGFSFHDDYAAFDEIIHAHPWDFCQLQLNYADTEKQAGLRGYHLAESLGIPVVVMEPVKGGRLSRAPEKSAAAFAQRHPHWSCSSWALRWAASLPNVAAVLSGMSSMEQVRDNLATFEDPVLDEEDRRCIEDAAREIASLQQVSCTGCRYCMPCPAGVEIADIFALWNDGTMFGVGEESRARYGKYGKEQKASACVRCGKCASLCPQGILIPDMLARAHVSLTQA